jgi:hypothetical protein
MEDLLTANEVRWEAQQLANKARVIAERRVWMKNFVLVFILVILAVAVAALVRLRGAPTLSL